MDRAQAIDALKATGMLLQRTRAIEQATVILGGAVAGMVTAGLPVSRVTHDCDVLAAEPDDRWEAVDHAARQVAAHCSLPDDWLNRDAGAYAHLLPPGWRDRSLRVGRFGPLTVLAISRRDLMAMKLIGAAVRPQDLEDVMSMRPTTSDRAFLAAHLGRLEAESLAGESFDAQRAVLNALEPTDDSA